MPLPKRHSILCPVLKDVTYFFPIFVGCFNQLTNVLDENWICLEERKMLLARLLARDFVCLLPSSLCVILCASVHACVSDHCPHQSQPIHNSNGLCFSHTSLSMQLTSAYLMAWTELRVHKGPPHPFLSICPLAFRGLMCQLHLWNFEYYYIWSSIQALQHTICNSPNSLWKWLGIALRFILGLLYCIWRHSSLIYPSAEILNSLPGTARLSSEEFIPQKIGALWIASFLARAIFFCSYDWSQISHSTLLTCKKDFELESLLPLNGWLYGSESANLWKARTRLYRFLWYMFVLPFVNGSRLCQEKRGSRRWSKDPSYPRLGKHFSHRLTVWSHLYVNYLEVWRELHLPRGVATMMDSTIFRCHIIQLAE